MNPKQKVFKQKVFLTRWTKLTQTELEKLKALITPEEQAGLNIEYFSPTNTDRCIYGQLTGSCDSNRSIELQTKCIEAPFSESIEKYYKPIHKRIAERRILQVFTPLECYIAQASREQHVQIIDYLKGATDSIKLKHPAGSTVDYFVSHLEDLD